MSTDVWYLDDSTYLPTIKLEEGQSWPSDLHTSREGKVLVAYEAHLGPITGPQIEQALLIIVEDLYNNPGSYLDGNKKASYTAAERLLMPFRRQRW